MNVYLRTQPRRSASHHQAYRVTGVWTLPRPIGFALLVVIGTLLVFGPDLLRYFGL